MRFLAIFLLFISMATPVHAGTFSCLVQSPIYRTDLDAGAMWHFEAFNGTPGATYHVKVNWPGDPSNGAHSNTNIGPLDANGYGIMYLPSNWSPDGFLPQIGAFSVQVYSPDIGTGNAKCKGEVSP
jgi:hypothetical protein